MGFASGNYGYKVCDVDVPEQKKPVDALDKDRTHLGEIYIRWISDSRPETSSSDLQRSIEDHTPAAIRRGGKDMLNYGTCRWLGLRKSYMKKPRLMFPAFSASLTAVSDPTYKLAANEVYVVEDGKPYIGPVTMWRYPLHTITVQEHELLWKTRWDCRAEHPTVLPRIVDCVDYRDRKQVAQLHQLLASWPEIPLEKALHLLDYACECHHDHLPMNALYTDPDERVHEYAVRCLEKEGDEKLELYMSQLVQV